MAKNSTDAIVPVTAVAEATSVFAENGTTEPPVAGETIATVGALPPETVTVTPVEVVVAPRLSVATAVRMTVPAMVGVKETEYGAVVSGLPIAAPFAKNCTLAIEPSVSAAVAVTVVATPTPIVAPFDGAVMLTIGAALACTVTEIAVLVA